MTLMVCESTFRLHINMRKSKIYQANQAPDLEVLAEILSCKTDSLTALLIWAYYHWELSSSLLNVE